MMMMMQNNPMAMMMQNMMQNMANNMGGGGASGGGDGAGLPSMMPEQAPVDSRVSALCREFNIDNTTCRTLHDVMKSREDYDEDIQALHQVMVRAVNKGKKPLEVMLTQIRSIKSGRFAGKDLLDKDVWAFAEKYNLDDRVLGRLIQTLNNRKGTKKSDLAALDERLAAALEPEQKGSGKGNSGQTGLGLLVRLLEGLEETGRLPSPPRRLGGSGAFRPTGTFLHPIENSRGRGSRDDRRSRSRHRSRSRGGRGGGDRGGPRR